MKNLISYILFGVLFNVPYVFAINAGNWSMIFDFKSAISHALEHSPSLAAFRRSYEISKLVHKNRKSDFLPSIEIKSDHMVGKNSVSDNSSIESRLGVELTENLYKNGENITNYKKTKLQQELAFIIQKERRSSLIKSIACDYLDFSLHQEISAIKTKNLSLFKEQYQKALEQYHQGLKPQKDVIRFKSQMQQAEIELLQSRNNVELFRQKLLKDMGYAEGENIFGEVKFIPVKLASIDTSMLPTNQPDLTKQPTYKIMLLQKEINKLDVSLAKRKYWVQVDLKAGVTYGNDLKSGIVSSFGREKELDWQAMLELKYRLLDWGKQKRDISIAVKQGKKEVDDLNQQLLITREGIEDVMLGLELHKRSYKISKELKRSAYKNYLTIDKSYRVGDAEYLDLTEAIKDLFAAKVGYASDRYALEKELYMYYYYIGIIYGKVFK
jgi:outer membrane protein TolC